MFNKTLKGVAFALASAALTPMSANADTIDPVTYSDTLAVGESVTIRKTVTISAGGPTTAPLDVMFVFDVTGSMGDEIATAKAAANDILAGLAGFGSLRSGSGWYSDTDGGSHPTGFDGVHVDLNDTNTSASSGIDDMWDAGTSTVAGTFVGRGGDTPELGYAGISDAADSASWAAGSSRFIIAFGDAEFKTPPTDAETIASLTAADATLIGINYDTDIGTTFATDIADLGGIVVDGTGVGADTAAIIELILASVGSTFDEYEVVTVDDLGLGSPGVGVDVVCVDAAGGFCEGANAEGEYDRTVDRTFGFDVTFTGLAEGVYDFPVHALVDGGIVATEKDFITVPRTTSVPEPSILALLAIGLIGVGASRRRA